MAKKNGDNRVDNGGGQQMDVGGDKLSDKHAKGTNEPQVFP